MANTLRPLRDEALNNLAKIVEASWGPRCSRSEAGCITCLAWAIFDQAEKITEGSVLDDEDDYRRAFPEATMVDTATWNHGTKSS